MLRSFATDPIGRWVGDTFFANCKPLCNELRRSKLMHVSLRRLLKVCFRNGSVLVVSVISSGSLSLLAVSGLVGLVVVQVALELFGG